MTVFHLNEENTPPVSITERPIPCAHPYVPRTNTGGNFCGHDPANPRFPLTTNPFQTGDTIDDLGDNRRSAILYTICERLKAYYNDPSTIPPFNSANRDKRKSDRQRNSTRREAMVALTEVMVMNMDLVSFRVGYPSEIGFVNRTVKWLAKKAKLSLSRAERALADLNDAGVITSYQYRELLDAERKEYRFHTAVRTFHRAFFNLLGISDKALDNVQDYAEQKQALYAKTNSLSARISATLKLTLNATINRQNKRGIALNGDEKAFAEPDSAHKNSRDSSKQRPQEHHAQAQRRSQIVVELLQAEPELAHNDKALRQAIEQRLQKEGLPYEIPF